MFFQNHVFMVDMLKLKKILRGQVHEEIFQQIHQFQVSRHVVFLKTNVDMDVGDCMKNYLMQKMIALVKGMDQLERRNVLGGHFHLFSIDG